MVKNISSEPARSGQASSTMQPRSLNVFRCASSIDRTLLSSGKPPRSRDQATRTFLKSRSKGSANTWGSEGYTAGSRESAPAIALNRKATFATDRAIGPLTLNPKNGNAVGADGTSPTVGRSATILLKLAGFLSEPPRSLPLARGKRPAASAAPAPPLDPPAVFVKSYGLTVVP